MEKKINFSMIVISDAHFYSADDKSAKLFLNFLNNLDCKNLEYFVLLGDIFDFCFGSSKYFKNKFQPFSDALAKIQKNGVKIVYLQGNHEFSLSDINWPHVKIVEDFSEQITLANGERFVLTHGDRLLAPKSYFWYLSVTRSKIFSFLAKLLPQKWLDDLALSISKKSRKGDVYRVLNHDLVLEKVNLWLADYPGHHGLFGHFHYPYFQNRSNDNGKIISMESWLRPNFLAFENGNFYRIFLQDTQNTVVQL